MTHIVDSKVRAKVDTEDPAARLLTAGAGIQTADGGAGNGAVVALYVAHHYTYATQTAREAATGFVVGDVGKVAFQESDGTYWTLTDDDPITWVAKTVTVGSGGGAGAFTDLTDAPASYSGQSLKLVRVNTGETALEFVSPSAGSGFLYPACGRLTLESGVPVSTADQTAKTTLYYTPYIGNQIALFNGATWDLVTFAELSIAVPATTSTMYDVFCYNNSGTATLELTAWTNDTTRATALVRQDGVLCKTGALTRRWLGCMRTTGVSGQTELSAVNLFVWNFYNQVDDLVFLGAGPEHTCGVGGRLWNNTATGNQVSLIYGGYGSATCLLTYGATFTRGGSYTNLSLLINGAGQYTTYVRIGIGGGNLGLYTTQPNVLRAGFNYFNIYEASDGGTLTEFRMMGTWRN